MKIKLPDAPSITAKGFDDLIDLFYGPPGVGKSSFVNGLAKRVLFLSTDRGTRNIKTRRVEAFNWKQCLRILDLLEEDDAPHYDIFCIDHVDDWARMCEMQALKDLDVESLTDRKLPYGKGWSTFKGYMRGYMNRILELNMGLVFIAHETTKTIKTRGTELEYVMPTMGKTAWDLIIPTIDIIGRIAMRSVKVKGKRKEVRTLVTQPTETVYAKDRSLRITDGESWEPLDPKAFLKTFEGAY